MAQIRKTKKKVAYPCLWHGHYGGLFRSLFGLQHCAQVR